MLPSQGFSARRLAGKCWWKLRSLTCRPFTVHFLFWKWILYILVFLENHLNINLQIKLVLYFFLLYEIIIAVVWMIAGRKSVGIILSINYTKSLFLFHSFRIGIILWLYCIVCEPEQKEAMSCRSTACFISNWSKVEDTLFPTQSEETKHTFLFYFFFPVELPRPSVSGGGKTEARLMQLFPRLFTHFTHTGARWCNKLHGGFLTLSDLSPLFSAIAS